MASVISASRRTDIPAFYAEWFMNRVRAGYCLVPNPFNHNQASHVSLAPQDVDAIVFWTKNPASMLPHIDELERIGFRFYFQFTLNAYPKALEPGLPSVQERIKTFKKLSTMIGPERVIWRYDPIIISNQTDFLFHRRKFAQLCGELKQFTKRAVVSIVDFYSKTERNLKALEDIGFIFDRDAVAKPEMEALLADFAAVALRFAIEIQSCAEKKDFSKVGVRPGRCIDGDLIDRMSGMHRHWKKDPHQRKECGCVVSKDIGENDSCLHNCPYCYATRDGQLACKRNRTHDPQSSVLLGHRNEPARQRPKASQQVLF